MATLTKPTTIRIEDDLKSQAMSILDSIGLSFSSYVQLATRQLVNQRRIPFELLAVAETPNEETYRALVAAEARTLGLIPDDSPVFTDADELVDFLENGS